jgi:hypothetical protein
LTAGIGNDADYDRAAGGHRRRAWLKWKDLPRAALESLALEAYRSRALIAAQLGRVLVFETRLQIDAFLKDHEIYDYSASDFEHDRETLRELRMREAGP